jgi:hypothetical protein
MVVAVSTAFYVILTRSLVKETKKLREAQTEPKISICIKPNENCLLYCDMIIQNIGLGAAYNLNFKVGSDVRDFDRKPLSELNIIKNGIRYLTPSEKRQFFLTQFSRKVQEKMVVQDSFEIETTYENEQGKKFKDRFIIDFSEFFDLTKLGESPTYSIARSLKNIEQNINHLSTGFHKLKVIAYTKKEIED